MNLDYFDPLTLCDFYKVGHPHQYPKNTQIVYSNTTARASRIPGVNHVVVFGIQYLVKEYFQRVFNENFFHKSKYEVIERYRKRLETSLGPTDANRIEHIAALHDLGYLPIKVKALPEGTLCPIGVPFLTVENTDERFGWITNFVETIIQTTIWQAITSATTANRYSVLLDKYAAETSDIPEFVDFQAHDFSMRGLSTLESACMSGAAHLISFKGTDTIPALDFIENYYLGNGFLGGSVAATEHSVMTIGGPEGEFDIIKRLITEVYPTGILSMVCDGFDYWNVIDNELPKLKDIINARDGKVVIRPDSGDPVQIILETIPKLYNIFGGEKNSKGYIQLNPKIGLIYGDSITFERAEQVVEGLKKLGFASTNIVFGVGSYTYQYVTRDTFSIAMKATWAKVDGVEREIFKAPKTDSGMKNSAKGLLHVTPDLKLIQSATREQERTSALKTVFENGRPTNTTWYDIQSTLKNSRKNVYG